jgi:ribosomal-protein-alanine N-acetyltransferase
MMQFPILESERLILREFRGSDAQAVFRIFSQDVVTKHYSMATMRHIDQAKRLVEARASLFPRGIGLRWAITLKGKADEVIGSGGFYKVNKGFRSLEIGYDLHPTYWRKGIMLESLTALIEFGYSDAFDFRLNRLEALTELENRASIGLLKKLGFEEEGIRREYGYWKSEFHDVRSFSLLRRDWSGRTGADTDGAVATFWKRA